MGITCSSSFSCGIPNAIDISKDKRDNKKFCPQQPPAAIEEYNEDKLNSSKSLTSVTSSVATDSVRKDDGTIIDAEFLHFDKFRSNTIGIHSMITTHQGKIRCIYADWTASGRLYRPIEEKIAEIIGPYVANTHTETSSLGHVMTFAYQKARDIIKQHVNASPEHDILVPAGSGMTGAVIKLQSILGLRIHEQYRDQIWKTLPIAERPIIFITHYEHHSNQISWENCLADVIIVPPTSTGLVSVDNFETEFQKYANRKIKYAAISACSNVTGIRTPYHEIAQVVHRHGGYIFVDFATSFGYVPVDMHPANDPESRLDAIFIAPHKLLGGPGTSGILLFHDSLYHLQKPDICGGGTVTWTNPWGEQGYIDNIEQREDAGSPPFLQVIRVSLAIRLKEEMDPIQILAREHVMNTIVFETIGNHKNIHILAKEHTDRLSIFAILIDQIHYNLIAKILNDYFGIQCRGGCNCAGSYAHYLFNVTSYEVSHALSVAIDGGDFSTKPGWCRISLHPTMTDSEIHYICQAIITIANTPEQYTSHYCYDLVTNQYFHEKQEYISSDWIDHEMIPTFFTLD